MAKPPCAAMAWDGRFLVIGFAAGDIPKLPLNLVLLKSYDVLGVFWGSWIEREPAGHRANTEQLLAWCAQGKLSSHVHAVYPLERGAGRAQGDRRAPGDGQGDPAALELAPSLSRAASRCAGGCGPATSLIAATNTAASSV